MDINYKLQKINISSIPKNKHLEVSIQERDIDRCVKTIRNYGLLTSIVVGKITEEDEVVLSGQCEINAMREMKIKKTDAIVINCKDNSEASKISLLISSLHQQPSAVAEGLLIINLIGSKNFKQKDIAHLIGKSESWVAKRIGLVQKLSKPVIDMVISKNLCSRTAEEISRLPEEVQLNFAQKVVSFNLPKSKVEQLVVMYNNPSVGENIKKIILDNPQNTINISTKKVKKIPNRIFEDYESRKLALIKTSISIIIRSIADIETNINQVLIEKIHKQSDLVVSCILSSERFIKMLLKFTNKSFPRETSNMTGGDKDES